MVASFVRSDVSSKYWTLFSTSIARIVAGGVCAGSTPRHVSRTNVLAVNPKLLFIGFRLLFLTQHSDSTRDRHLSAAIPEQGREGTLLHHRRWSYRTAKSPPGDGSRR